MSINFSFLRMWGRNPCMVAMQHKNFTTCMYAVLNAVNNVQWDLFLPSKHQDLCVAMETTMADFFLNSIPSFNMSTTNATYNCGTHNAIVLWNNVLGSAQSLHLRSWAIRRFMTNWKASKQASERTEKQIFIQRYPSQLENWKNKTCVPIGFSTIEDN